MPDEVPGGGVKGTRRSALPPGPPYFAGRRRELAELRADIDRPGLDALRGRPATACRVLLVAGRPGSGRTSLAVRLARAVGARYPDGVLFARLTGPDGEPLPVANVAGRLLDGMPWRADDAPPPEDPVAALRAACQGRAVVLVLDDAVHPDQVLPLLPAGAESLVIATAAGPLPGVPDVRPCALGGLDSDAGVDLLAHAIGEIRVTVDPTAAHTLCESCEGNPAALRLVGGWLAARPRASVPDATRALREAAEDGSDPGGPAARAFRMVHASLPQASARLLRLLALAPGGLVDPHVASALAGSSLETAREALFDFTAHGLLQPDPAGCHRVPGWLAPLLRAAVERERPAEVRLARARMLERTVRLLQACRAVAEPDDPVAARRLEELPRAVRFASRTEAGEWLAGRLPGLLDAARIAVADGELDTLARRLLASLVRALDLYDDGTGPAPQLYASHALLLEIAERRGLARDKAAALINLADLDMAADRFKDAAVRYRAALHETRGAADSLTAGRAMEALGAAYLELGDPERSTDWFGRALALRQTRGEAAEVARLHGRLGDLHRDHGRFTIALREWRCAAAAYRRLRDLSGYAAALGEAAGVQRLAGHLDEALKCGHEALRWARQAGDARVEGAVLLGMADTLDRLGDPAGARLQREAAASLCAGAAPQWGGWDQGDPGDGRDGEREQTASGS